MINDNTTRCGDRPPLNPHLRWLLTLLVALPFVTTVKLPPLGNFWGEWIAALLAVALLAQLNWEGRRLQEARANVLPWAALPFVGLALLMAVQLTLNFPLHRASYLIPVGELGIAAALAVAGATVTLQGGLRRGMDALSLGLLLALALNFVGLLIEISGHEIFMASLVDRAVPPRALALVGQPNQLAVLAVLAWCAAQYRWSSGSSSLKVVVLAMAMASVLVAASGSRAGLVCWGVAMLLAGWATLRSSQPAPEGSGRLASPRDAVSARFWWGSAALFVLVQLVWNLALPRFADAPASALRSTAAPRLEVIADGWQMWLNHPLLGVGWGQFSASRLLELSAPMLEPNSAHAHNLLIHLLAEFGLVGALLCLVPLVAVGAATVRQLRLPGAPPPELVLAAALVLTLLVYSLLEYPLWYTYFLFPFAFLFGCLPQGVWCYRSSKNIGVIRTGAWAVVGALCFVVAVDYVRLQSIYTEVGRQRQANQAAGDAWIEIPAQIEVVSQATFFPLKAEYMYARTLKADGFLVNYKRGIAWRVMLGLPTGETVARYVALSLAEGDAPEADRWLTMAGHRNRDMFDQAVLALRAMAPDQPAVARYLGENGLR